MGEVHGDIEPRRIRRVGGMKRKVAQGVAAGTAVAMALQPRIDSAERRGVELAVDLRSDVEDAILRCTRRADRLALEGSIAPDIVIMDDKGVIILVYDMKFPCPESNGARWDFYSRGPWALSSQDEIYFQALRSEPLLVSPQEGVQQREDR